MQRLRLSLACWEYDRNRAIIDGRIKPEGIDFDVQILRPRETFQRMLDHQEFQVSELSLASYTALKARGQCPFVAIPVPLSKIFRHSCIYVRTDAGINKPEDLKGKRVGTSQYSSTGLTFIRGMLEHDFGVRSQDMIWHMGGMNTFREKPLLRSICPRKFISSFCPRVTRWRRSSRAANLTRFCRCTSRISFLMAIRASSACSRLQVCGARLLQAHSHSSDHAYDCPAEDVYQQHPWAARAIYDAFCAAREEAVEGLYDTDALKLTLPWLLEHVEEAWRVFGKDYWPYGVEANRATWQAIGQYVHEQGLAPRAVSVEEMFPAEFT